MPHNISLNPILNVSHKITQNIENYINQILREPTPLKIQDPLYSTKCTKFGTMMLLHQTPKVEINHDLQIMCLQF